MCDHFMLSGFELIYGHENNSFCFNACVRVSARAKTVDENLCLVATNVLIGCD